MTSRSTVLAAVATAAGLLLLTGCSGGAVTSEEPDTGGTPAPAYTSSLDIEMDPTPSAAPSKAAEGLSLEAYQAGVLEPDAEATALWGEAANDALTQGVAALKVTVYNDGLWAQTTKTPEDFDFASDLMTPGAYDALIAALQAGDANTVLTFALINTEEETVTDAQGAAFRQDPVVPRVTVSSEPVMSVETDEERTGDTAPRYAMTTTLIYHFAGESLSSGERHEVAYERPVTFYMAPDANGDWLVSAWYSESMSLVTE